MTLKSLTNPNQDKPIQSGVSSLGVPWVPRHPQILEDQLTLSEPGGAYYVHHINGTPRFLDLPRDLTQTNPNQPKTNQGACRL